MSETEEQTAEAAPEVTRDTVDAVLAAVQADDHDALVALLEPLHAADVADILEQISRPERKALITLWGRQLDGAVLSELEEGVRDEIVAELPDHILAQAVQELDTDDVVYLAEDLEAPQQERILRALDAADRAAVEQSLQYGDYTAGRLMQREVVVAPEHWSVGDAIDFMRREEWLPDSFYDIVIVSPQMHPIGMVALGRLMGAGRRVKLKELMDEDFRTLRADQGQEDVAYVFNKYHLTTAPVVDVDGRLVGVITIDDAMEVLEEETEEDSAAPGGRRRRGAVGRGAGDRAGAAAVAVGESPDRDRVGGGDLGVHRHDPGLRGAGSADADRRLDGRQRRDAGADRHGAGAGDAEPQLGQPAPVRHPRGAGRGLQRRRLRLGDRTAQRALLPRRQARDGDRRRDGRQPRGRRLLRRADPDRAREAQGRSGAGVGDLRDDDHGRLRLLCVSRARERDPGLGLGDNTNPH